MSIPNFILPGYGVQIIPMLQRSIEEIISREKDLTKLKRDTMEALPARHEEWRRYVAVNVKPRDEVCIE